MTSESLTPERRALYARLLVDPAVIIADHRTTTAAGRLPGRLPVYAGEAQLDSVRVWIHLSRLVTLSRPKPYQARTPEMRPVYTRVTVELGDRYVQRRLLNGEFRTTGPLDSKDAVMLAVAGNLTGAERQRIIDELDNYHDPRTTTATSPVDCR